MSSPNQVPLLDLKPQYHALKGDILAALERVCDSQSFILGQSVRQLEANVAAYSGCRFGIGMASGTDALLAALMALDIGTDDAVITTPYTFFATAGTIARVGAWPLFVDIDPGTFNLTGEAVRRFLVEHCEQREGEVVHRGSGRQVKAIMPVHLYGQLTDMDSVVTVAKEFGLRIIEDAAQAIGSADHLGRRACSFGDIGCLSFFPTKNLGAFGDAGMCVTNDERLAARLARVRVHGMEPKYYHHEIGGNFRLDELQAAVLLVKFRHLDDWSRARQENACFYFGEFKRLDLTSVVGLPAALPGRHVYNQFIIRVSRRDELKSFLQAEGIGTEIYYPLPLHLQPCFAYLGHSSGAFLHAEAAARETLALPIYPELERAQLAFVVDRIATFYSRM